MDTQSERKGYLLLIEENEVANLFSYGLGDSLTLVLKGTVYSPLLARDYFTVINTE